MIKIASAAAAGQDAKGKGRIQKYSGLLLTVILVAVYILADIIVGGDLHTLNGLYIIYNHTLTTIFIAWALCFIFTSGYNLSMGANIIVSANCAILAGLTVAGATGSTILGTLTLIVVGIAVTAMLHMFCTAVSVELKIPIWITGLSMTLIYEAIAAAYGAYRMNNNQSVPALTTSGLKGLAAFPYSMIFLVIAALFTYFTYERTKVGLDFRAAGRNETVAKFMGINVRKSIYMGALIGGILLGMGTVMKVVMSGRVDISTGTSSISTIFKAMAVQQLGESLSRYINLTMAVLISGVFISLLFNVMTRLGVESGTWQNVVLGAWIVIMGWITNINKED